MKLIAYQLMPIKIVIASSVSPDHSQFQEYKSVWLHLFNLCKLFCDLLFPEENIVWNQKHF